MGDLISLYKCLKEVVATSGSVCSHSNKSNQKRQNGLDLCLGRFTLDSSKNFFTERVVKHENRMPRLMVQSPSPEFFKKCVDEEFRDLV